MLGRCLGGNGCFVTLRKRLQACDTGGKTLVDSVNNNGNNCNHKDYNTCTFENGFGVGPDDLFGLTFEVLEEALCALTHTNENVRLI